MMFIAYVDQMKSEACGLLMLLRYVDYIVTLPQAADRRPGETLGSQKNRGSVQVSEGSEELLGDGKNLPTPLRRALEFGLEDEDEEGDSFFDDPLPKPQKTYGW